MIPANDKYSDMLTACMAAIAPLNRGDVIPHESLEQAAGIIRYSRHWNHLIKKLRRRLRLDRGLSIWPVNGVGYKLCTREEQLNMVPEAIQKQAVRRATRALREVSALPAEELTVNQRRLKSYRMESIRRARLQLKRCIRDQRAEGKKAETLPRRPLPRDVREKMEAG